jgi:hypothetical protein
VFRILLTTLACSLLAACTANPPIIVEKPVEVKVPVTVPCVKERPGEVVGLRDRVGRADWDALSTDQREKLLQAQAQDRKAFGDRLTVATAGCV